jgi:CBS domain-containing protein
LVTAGDQVRGVVTLTDITKISKADWPTMTAEQVMTPWEAIVHVQPDTELIDALRAMDDANVAQAPVMKEERIAGVLSRDQVLHYIRLRTELSV